MFNGWNILADTAMTPILGRQLIEQHNSFYNKRVWESWGYSIIEELLSRINYYWRLFSQSHKHYNYLRIIINQKSFTKVIKMPSSDACIEISWILKLKGWSAKVANKRKELLIKSGECSVRLNSYNWSKSLEDNSLKSLVDHQQSAKYSHQLPLRLLGQHT